VSGIGRFGMFKKKKISQIHLALNSFDVWEQSEKARGD
jgi:hypothetical protein